MKLLVFSVLLAVAVAAPPPFSNSGREAQITRYDYDNIGVGSYRFGFEQTDGTRHDAQGELKNEGREDESLVVRGSYSWVGPDGVTYTVVYVADDNGFQPEIQQGPGGGVPPAVVASLLG